MRYKLFPKLPLLAVTLAAAPLAVATEPMTNQGLVALAEAGFGEQFLLDMVRTRPGKFDTSVEGLVYLAQRGISERLIREVAGLGEAKPAGQAPPAARIVRLRKVKQEVLVPEPSALPPGPGGPVIVAKDERLLRDRWYAIPLPDAGPSR